MSGNNGVFDSRNMVTEIFDLCTEFLRQAVAGGIGDVDYFCSGGNGGFNYPGKKFIVGASGIFRVKFHLIDQITGEFQRGTGLLNNAFSGGFEFVFGTVYRSNG